MQIESTRRAWFATLGSTTLFPRFAHAGQSPPPAVSPVEGAPARVFGDVLFEKYLAHETEAF